MANTDRSGDFFTRLVDRALGLTPTARPLLAPLYAPGPAISEAAAGPFMEGVERASEVELTQAQRGAPLPDRDEWTRSDDIKTARGISLAVSVPSEGERLTDQVNAPASGDEASAPFEPPVTPVRIAAPREQQDDIVMPSSRANPPSSMQAFSPAPTVKPVLPSQPALSSIQQAVQQEGTHPDVEGGAAASSAHREGPPAAPVREPPRILVPLERLVEAPAVSQGRDAATEDWFPGAGSPFQPAPLPASLPERREASWSPPQGRREQQTTPGRYEPARPAAPLPPPTIRITIGRVEVRAVGPSKTSPPAPAPSPRPALSLDEYLKQRNEARR